MSSNQAKPIDLRVRRTRMLIEKAFMELVQERAFQSITIQDITERAMVNRATFYDHFTDKYALLNQAMRSWFQQTVESKLPPDLAYGTANLALLIETLGEFLAQSDTHCRLKNPEAFPAFDEQVVEVLSELLAKWLAEQPHYQPPAPLMVDVTSWAMYGAARHWSKQKPRPPIKDFAEHIAPTLLLLLAQDADHAPVSA